MGVGWGAGLWLAAVFMMSCRRFLMATASVSGMYLVGGAGSCHLC
jgi:hypothetical protein